MTTLEEEWAKILEELMPPDASDIQKREMKKSFFLGAGCMLAKVSDAANEDNSDDEGVDIIQAYVDEIDDFFEKLVIDFVAGHEV